MDLGLNGKNAIITGGSDGIGLSAAIALSKEGANVAILARTQEKLDNAVKEIEKEAKGNILAISTDVRKESSVISSINKVKDEFGKIDILVNNAGILIREDLANVTLEGWYKVLDVNAKGVLLGCKFIVPEMRRTGGGSIVNISSISGIEGLGYPAYNASKGAVRAMTKNLACLHAGDNIRVNSIHPGIIRTDMMKNDSHTQEEWQSLIPLGRWGESIEVAYGVLYLASDESSFVTGSELVIDGGWTSQ